ncbi:hypothetical protein BH09BAC4_BH09BAC4_09320 [soil metagenome]
MKSSLRLSYFLALLLVMAAGCKKPASPAEYNAKAANVENDNSALNKLTQVTSQDMFSPPVASRSYS